jgi:hypothetical protein
MSKNKSMSAKSTSRTSSTNTSNRPSSYAKLTYIQKASRVNRKLRTGDISKIATETGYSTTHVSDVVSGKHFNESIMNRIYDLTRNRVSNTKKIDSLSN